MPLLPYPPTIVHADYTTPPPPPLVLVVPCPLHDPPVCSLDALTLHANEATVGGTSFHQAHGDLLAGAQGRNRLAPGADHLFINWRFAGPQYIRAARLDLSYVTGGVITALWTKTITWADGACPALGGTPFSGRLDDNDGERAATDAQNVAIVYHPVAAFPADHLDAQKAPYKLEMSITSVNGATVLTRTRWIYLDVEVADLTLELGPERILTQRAAPAAPVDPFLGFDRRNREIRAAMAHALGDPPSALAADAAQIDIPLDGSLFGADSAEWDDSSFHQAWQGRWRDGPYIPLVSRVRVYNAAGQPVLARLALGGSKFLWDWEGAALDLTHVHARSQNEIDAAYMLSLGHWPTGQSNTHTLVGGKRGGAAALFRHGDVGYQTYANAGDGLFPFQMQACGTRLGAIFSRARAADDDYASHTGAIFTPSVIAQDRYTLTMYFAYGDGWDVASTAAALRLARPYLTPSVTSGQLTVQRVVKIARWWRQNNTAQRGNFAWAHVAGDLRQSGIRIDATATANPTNIPAIDFRAAFQAAVGRLPNAQRGFLAPQDQQAAADRGYGIKLRSFDELRADVLARYRARLTGFHHVQLGGADPNAFDRIDARTEVYLQLTNQVATIATIRQTIVNVGLLRNWASTAALTEWMDGMLQILLPPDTPGGVAEVATAIVTSPLPGGDQAAIRELIRLAGVTSDNHREKALDVGHEVLCQICGVISEQNAPDEDGMQVFQFDFEDNFDQFSASGWAFDTPSNRTHCPECNTPLAAPDRAGRLCPNGGCAARLRTSASIMTLVPWRHMDEFQFTVWAGLQANKAKYWVLTNMLGTRPEILVVHEMGHHLCLPHSPHGFTVPNPVPGGAMWTLLSAAVNNIASVRAQLVAGTIPGGNQANLHAASHRSCIMGYNFAEMPNLHFCSKCTLRLRGWDSDHVRDNL